MSDWIKFEDQLPERGQLCEVLIQKRGDFPSIAVATYLMKSNGKGDERGMFFGLLMNGDVPRNSEYWRPFVPPEGMSVISWKVSEDDQEALAKVGIEILEVPNPYEFSPPNLVGETE